MSYACLCGARAITSLYSNNIPYQNYLPKYLGNFLYQNPLILQRVFDPDIDQMTLSGTGSKNSSMCESEDIVSEWMAIIGGLNI